MTRLARTGLYLQSAFYLASGLNHFWHLQVYLPLMPDHYSRPDAWIQLSGAAEILGGVGLLVPASRRFSSLGVTLMLLFFLDVHVFMLRHRQRFPGLPLWILWVRLPLQGVLILWALQYARDRNNSKSAAQQL